MWQVQPQLWHSPLPVLFLSWTTCPKCGWSWARTLAAMAPAFPYGISASLIPRERVAAFHTASYSPRVLTIQDILTSSQPLHTLRAPRKWQSLLLVGSQLDTASTNPRQRKLRSSLLDSSRFCVLGEAGSCAFLSWMATAASLGVQQPKSRTTQCAAKTGLWPGQFRWHCRAHATEVLCIRKGQIQRTSEGQVL
jgi:hypothetical protein